jgi:hypothetical protein
MTSLHKLDSVLCEVRSDVKETDLITLTVRSLWRLKNQNSLDMIDCTYVATISCVENSVFYSKVFTNLTPSDSYTEAYIA